MIPVIQDIANDCAMDGCEGCDSGRWFWLDGGSGEPMVLAVARPDTCLMLHFLYESIFLSICGWVGHVVVRILTLGRVRLELSAEPESNVTAAVGAIVLLLAGIMTVWVID